MSNKTLNQDIPGRPQEMRHNTLHQKVSQFDNVLMIHVCLCQTSLTLN